jgi:hypothetical protein
LRDKVPSACTLLLERHRLIHGPEDTKHWKVGYTGMLLLLLFADYKLSNCPCGTPCRCLLVSASAEQIPKGNGAEILQKLLVTRHLKIFKGIIPKPDSSLPCIFLKLCSSTMKMEAICSSETFFRFSTD